MSKNQFNAKSFKESMASLASQYDEIMKPKQETKGSEDKLNTKRFSEWTTKEWEDWQRGDVY